MKRSRIRLYKLQYLLLCMKTCSVTFFVALGMWSEEILRKVEYQQLVY